MGASFLLQMSILDKDFQPDHINVDSNSNSNNHKFHSAKDHMKSNRVNKPTKRPSVDEVNEMFQKKVIFKSIIFQPI